MRRKDKERTHAEFLTQVLSEAEFLCLALNTDSAPYAVFMNFIYKEGALFVHCAHEGYKLDLLRADARVGFTVATDICVVPEQFTTRYRSVSGTGFASIVDDDEEKQAVFSGFAGKYKAACPDPVPDAMVRRMCVLRITIESMTGKHSQGKL